MNPQTPVIPTSRWKNPATGGNIASGIGALSAVAGAFTPNTYNPKVGMEKPNPMKQFTDLQMTSMGASFGPVGMGVGFAADMTKNAIAYQKAKQQYETAENKAEYYDDRANRLATMQPDLTGFAKYGAARYGEVIAENGEKMYTEDKDDYKAIDIKGATHEEGGVKMAMPPNSVVAPREYAANMDHNLDKKENMEQLKHRMAMEGKKAANLGLPFSSAFRTARYGEDNSQTPTDATITPNTQPAQTTTQNLQMPTTPPPTTENVDLQQPARPENQAPPAPTPPANVKMLRDQSRMEAMRLGVYYDKNGEPATYWDERSQTRRFKADNTVFDPSKAQPRVEQTTTPKPTAKTPAKTTTPAKSTQEPTQEMSASSDEKFASLFNGLMSGLPKMSNELMPKTTANVQKQQQANELKQAQSEVQDAIFKRVQNSIPERPKTEPEKKPFMPVATNIFNQLWRKSKENSFALPTSKKMLQQPIDYSQEQMPGK